MLRHEFLRRLHELCQPRTYFEIGVNDGRSLNLSKARTIAVDPAFKIVSEVNCDVRIAKLTSDDFFDQTDPVAHLDNQIDLAFVDGMHLSDYVLRDFNNIERYADWASVVVFDDMLPRNVDEAARDRHTRGWTGDVYKIITILQRYRPGLVVVPVDTRPTGLLVVFGADPTDRTLEENYQQILDECVVPDPQSVPNDILDRSIAVKPEGLLDASFWPELVRMRDRDVSRRRGWKRVGKELAQITGR